MDTEEEEGGGGGSEGHVVHTSWMPFLQEDDPLPQQVSPYATTSTAAMEALFALLPHPLSPSHDVLCDLGCGDGRIVIHAAVRHAVRGFGVDLNAGLLRDARDAAHEEGVGERVVFEERSFLEEEFQFQLPWQVDQHVWNGPTLITSYLTPKALRLLEPKLVAYVRRAKERANIDVQVATLVYSFNNWTAVAENDSLKISLFDFRDDSMRIRNKKTNKDTDGYLPAF